MKKFVLLKYCKLSFLYFCILLYNSIIMKIIKEGGGVIICCFIFVCLLNYVRCIVIEVNL